MKRSAGRRLRHQQGGTGRLEKASGDSGTTVNVLGAADPTPKMVLAASRSYLHSLITWWMSNSKAAIRMLSRGSGLLSPPRNRSRLDWGEVVTTQSLDGSRDSRGWQGCYRGDPGEGRAAGPFTKG